MAPSADFLEPGGRPVAVCSKTRTPSFLRSGRALGRQRSCSRGRCSSACPEPDEKRGRSLTREPDRECRSRPALGQSDASVLEVLHPEQAFQPGSPLPKVFHPAQTSICAAVAGQSVPRQCESFSLNGARNDVASGFLLITDAVDKQSDDFVRSVKQVASSYVGKLFQAASDQYLSSAKQVALSYVGKLIADVMDKYPEEFPSCAKDLPRCLVAEEEVCGPTLIPTYVLRCDEDDCSDFGDSEHIEGVDRSAKVVGALDMTDPSSGKLDDNAQMAPQAHHSSFSDYVQDMFEAAFSGNVLEFFEPQNQTQGLSDPGSQSLDEAFDILPCAASLKACSRPTFRKRVRPRELPPGEEELPMDCLPSTPPCLSAPEGPSLRIWAEKLQEATFAEHVRSQASLSSPCQAKSELGLPLDEKASEEKYVPVPYCFLGQRMLDGAVSEEQGVSEEKTSVVPVLPSGQKTAGRAGSRPRPAQRTQDLTDAPKSDTPRHAITPRPCQQGIILMPEPSAPTAQVIVVPVPPSGPAPNARVPSCRRFRQPHQNTSTMMMGQPLLGAHKKVAAYGNMSPRPPPETPPNSFTAALREALSVRSPRDHGYKSAMAMDLGEEAITPTEMLPSKMVHSSEANVASKGFLKAGFAKYSAGLPQISPRPTWGGIEAACGDTWKAHDII